MKMIYGYAQWEIVLFAEWSCFSSALLQKTLAFNQK